MFLLPVVILAVVSVSVANGGDDRGSPRRGEIGAFAEEMAVHMERREEAGDGVVWSRHCDQLGRRKEEEGGFQVRGKGPGTGGDKLLG